MPTRRIADLILESATDYAIITTDLKGDITFWNSGAEKVLGWSELDVRETGQSDIYAGRPDCWCSADGSGRGADARACP
jgi:PAS domain S-box-containing protein